MLVNHQGRANLSGKEANQAARAPDDSRWWLRNLKETGHVRSNTYSAENAVRRQSDTSIVNQQIDLVLWQVVSAHGQSKLRQSSHLSLQKSTIVREVTPEKRSWQVRAWRWGVPGRSLNSPNASYAASNSRTTSSSTAPVGTEHLHTKLLGQTLRGSVGQSPRGLSSLDSTQSPPS